MDAGRTVSPGVSECAPSPWRIQEDEDRNVDPDEEDEGGDEDEEDRDEDEEDWDEDEEGEDGEDWDPGEWDDEPKGPRRHGHDWQ